MRNKNVTPDQDGVEDLCHHTPLQTFSVNGSSRAPLWNQAFKRLNCCLYGPMLVNVGECRTLQRTVDALSVLHIGPEDSGKGCGVPSCS